jgi:hypothetical protein
MFTNRSGRRSPYIRENLFQRNKGDTSGSGIWQLVALRLLTWVTNIWIYFMRMG